MWLVLLFGCAQDPREAADTPVPVAPAVGATPEVAGDEPPPPQIVAVPYGDRIDALARSRADLAVRFRAADASGRASIRLEARRTPWTGSPVS